VSTPLKIRRVGRPKGSPGVPRAEWGAIALLEAFGWPHYDIGQLWGISAVWVGQLTKKWRRA
jgi:hypothetical protein